MDSIEDLAQKMEILERELAVQRQALERLKRMGPDPGSPTAQAPAVRKPA
jgi:hypothetical protein